MATNSGSIETYFGTNLIEVPGLPLIAIPTTAGTGSEVTNISILSDKTEQVKKGIVSSYLLPDVAIVSPVMTLTCPPSVTAASGVDALVHAVEAYISKFASPVTDALAIGAMKLIAKNLSKAYAAPDNLEAREAMITGSLMAGLAFEMPVLSCPCISLSAWRTLPFITWSQQFIITAICHEVE